MDSINILEKMIHELNIKVDKGETKGELRCPYCNGVVEYIYESPMSMRAKCKSCSFRMFS